MKLRVLFYRKHKTSKFTCEIYGDDIRMDDSPHRDERSEIEMESTSRLKYQDIRELTNQEFSKKTEKSFLSKTKT